MYSYEGAVGVTRLPKLVSNGPPLMSAWRENLNLAARKY
jgi:hypothetical protein